MKTISVQFQGGLGAQLYQIAEVYRQSKLEDDRVIFDYRTARRMGQGEAPFFYKESLYKNLPWSFNEPDKVIRGFFNKAPTKRELSHLNKILNLPPIEPIDREGLHIRLGDLLQFGLDHISPMHFKRFVNDKTLIFTDSPQVCAEIFPGIEIYRGADYDSFLALRNCTKIITNCSAYSHWAAYLSEAKEVIAPFKDWALKGWVIELVEGHHCL